MNRPGWNGCGMGVEWVWNGGMGGRRGECEAERKDKIVRLDIVYYECAKLHVQNLTKQSFATNANGGLWKKSLLFHLTLQILGHFFQRCVSRDGDTHMNLRKGLNIE